jgi:hypothetical protein
MPKTCLTKDEIRTLTQLIRKVFVFLERLKARNVLAERIQYPKIPPILSESIAIHLIRDRKILRGLMNFRDVYFGGRESDLIVERGSRKLRVEVKSTGKNAFEYFGPKDISADCLVWVHFGDFFTRTTGRSVSVFTIARPSRYFAESVKITLDKLQKTMSPTRFELDLDLL